MSDVFISYARSTAGQAQQIAEALRALGYGVWRDDELPAHRSYAEVIEERLKNARAVVVVWSAEAVKSEWVQSEADRARTDRKLVQLTIDGATPPMPFDRIQCADLCGWTGEARTPGWRKVMASIAELVGAASVAAEPVTAVPPPLPGKPSIAVLPFANLSNDPDQEYFADGMVVEVVAALSRCRSIFVIASGSSLSFKGKGLSSQEAGRRLGVRYVLEGSVRKGAGRVRIAVQLVDAEDGAQIWTERFEDTLDDVFALQDKVALSTVGVIEPAVREAEIRRASTRPTDNMGSYDLYLRSMAIVRTYVWSDMTTALALAHRAIELDPLFGAGVALAARLHYLIFLYGWSEDPEHHRRQAIELSHRSLRLAGDDANILGVIASIFAYLEHDIDSAVRLVEQAIALNPGSSAAWSSSGAVRVLSGEFDLAIEHLETSMRLDPMGPDRPTRLLFIAMARFQQQRFGEAATICRELVQHTDNPSGWAILAASCGLLGQKDAGVEALSRYRTLAPQPIDVYARSIWPQPAHRSLFLEGIALAEGKRDTVAHG